MKNVICVHTAMALVEPLTKTFVLVGMAQIRHYLMHYLDTY